MHLYQLLDLYLSVSQKADNYWTIYIIVTVSLLAASLPMGTAISYVVEAFISLIFGIYSYVNSWALGNVYYSLKEIGSEIAEKAHESSDVSERFSVYVSTLKDLLPGEWNAKVHALFVVLLFLAMFLKAYHQHNNDD